MSSDRQRKQSQTNKLVQDNFYSEKNIDLMERSIVYFLKTEKKYRINDAELDAILNKGMEYAIRTNRPKGSGISMVDYIKEVLDKTCIKYCIDNVNTDKPPPRSRDKSVQEDIHRRREFRPSSRRENRRHIEEDDDFHIPSKKVNSIPKNEMDQRFKSLQKKRSKYDPLPAPSEKKSRQNVREREYEDYDIDEEDIDEDANDDIDDEFLNDVDKFMNDEPNDPDIEDFRTQLPDANPLPSKSQGHVVPVSKIPQVFTIDSRDREQKDSTNPNDYKVKLLQSYRGVSHVELVSANIPKSGYIVNSNNNIINFTDSGGAPALIATLTPGNYTADELASEIDTQMTASSLASGASDSYTVTNNAKSSKFTIIQAVGGPFEIQFNGGTEKFGSNSNTRSKLLPNSAGDILGFGPNDQTGALTYTSSFRYNLAGPSALLLEIEELGGRIQGSNHEMTNVFAHVPFSASTSAINFHTNQSDTKNVKYFSPPKAKLEKLTIRWRDYLGNLYDFNGLDHFIEMNVYTIEQER